MRKIPQTSFPPVHSVPTTHAPNGSAGQIGGAVKMPVVGVRRDFTFTPQFHPGLTTNGQTIVPRG